MTRQTRQPKQASEVQEVEGDAHASTPVTPVRYKALMDIVCNAAFADSFEIITDSQIVMDDTGIYIPASRARNTVRQDLPIQSDMLKQWADRNILQEVID